MAQSRGKALNGGGAGRKGSGSGPPPVHLILLELKHRILAAINKLADRDTQQIAVEDLERIAESLSPEGIALCLGCLYDTNSEQKSIARRECIRLFGTLALLHGYLLAPYLPKIISCIIRRLKDPDTIVRDACVDAVGSIALNVICPEDEEWSAEDDCEMSFPSVFEVFFKPLVEALNEQNKCVQIGAAMCLARLIESSSHPMSSSTQRLYPRIVKLLKSSSFLAKAALLSVVGSLTQAKNGEADQFLASMVPHLQASLESSDWAIRKAAVDTLARVASERGSAFSLFRSSALGALESCRFDKVKPVRESALTAIEMWKTVPAVDTEISAPEAKTDTKGTVRHTSSKRSSPSTNSSNRSLSSKLRASEEGFLFKTETAAKSPLLRVDYASTISPVSGVTMDMTRGSTSKKRSSFGINKKGNPEFFRKLGRRSSDDWPIEVVVPRGCPPSNIVSVEQDAENQSSDVGETDVRMESEKSADEVDHYVCQLAAIKEIVSFDQKEKPEIGHNPKAFGKEGLPCLQFKSSTVPVNFESYGDGIKQQSSPRKDENSWLHNGSQEIDSEDLSCSTPATFTSTCSNKDYGSNKGIANENQLASIQTQLARLEQQQSRLLEMLQEMMGNSHEGMQALDSRLQGLERIVDDVTKAMARFSGDTAEKVKVTVVGLDDKNTKLHEGTDSTDPLDYKIKTMNEGCEYSAGRLITSDAVASRATDGELSRITELEAKNQGSFAYTNRFEACAENKNTNVGFLEKQMRMVKGSLEVDRSGDGDVDRVSSFSNFAEVPSTRSIRQRCKDEATLKGFQIAREKPLPKPSEQDRYSFLSLRCSAEKPSLGSIRNKKDENVKGDAWDSWSRALDYLRAGNVNSAYMEVLDSNDELLLVHLMARTGPVLDQLGGDTAMQVFNTVTQLLCEQSFLDLALPWIQQIADMVTSDGLDYFDLSAEAKTALLRFLQEASQRDSAEGWFGSCGNQCAPQLAT
ncbi:hypothetical protein O6H91_17G035900 [Diphasiastrum complanatum]|uniref:Uncharacterized protein n=1 Tax=Diphasiastrum complanatum TaxID=34168 RepID=A0ACC2B5M9_DIPCM|nr:hypothetical protein O6H91_17G035900 [Diphasiastrum complanatum]